jgi:hypothetical protein
MPVSKTKSLYSIIYKFLYFTWINFLWIKKITKLIIFSWMTDYYAPVYILSGSKFHIVSESTKRKCFFFFPCFQHKQWQMALSSIIEKKFLSYFLRTERKRNSSRVSITNRKDNDTIFYLKHICPPNSLTTLISHV